MIKITEIATGKEWDFRTFKSLLFAQVGKIYEPDIIIFEHIFLYDELGNRMESCAIGEENNWHILSPDKFTVEDTDYIARDKILAALSKDESLKGSALYNDIFNICYGIPLSQIE